MYISVLHLNVDLYATGISAWENNVHWELISGQMHVGSK